MSVGAGIFWAGLFIGLGLMIGLAGGFGAIGNALKRRADLASLEAAQDKVKRRQ